MVNYMHPKLVENDLKQASKTTHQTPRTIEDIKNPASGGGSNLFMKTASFISLRISF
jgi:hypothetical protein